MHIRKPQIHITLSASVIVFAVALSSIYIVRNTARTNASTVTACPTPLQIVSPLSGQSVYGMTAIHASVSGTVNTTVNRAEVTIDGKPGGYMQYVSTSTSFWDMPWETRLLSNGNHTLFATIYYSDGMQCSSPQIQVMVGNATGGAASLVSQITPGSWQGPTNVNFDFLAKAGIQTTSGSTDISNFAKFTWESNIGSLTSSGSTAKFASGPQGGNGILKLFAWYGGIRAETGAQISVVSSSDSSTTYPSTNTSTTTETSNSGSGSTSTNSGTSSTSTNTGTTATTSTTSGSSSDGTTAPKPVEGDSELLRCLKSVLSESRVKEIIEKSLLPTPAEFEKIRGCLAIRSYVVPKTLSPVPPDEVSKKPETKDIEVHYAENKPVKNDNEASSQRTALVFSGKAKPLQTILLYVFSEPLILTTQADKDGNWSYQLEDPLEPGNHTAYAVVDKGDGNYERSSVFSFAIQSASASSENPKGYSLQLQAPTVQKRESTSRTLYIFAASGLIVGLITALLTYVALRQRQPKAVSVSAVNDTSSTSDSQPPVNTDNK